HRDRAGAAPRAASRGDGEAGRGAAGRGRGAGQREGDEHRPARRDRARRGDRGRGGGAARARRGGAMTDLWRFDTRTRRKQRFVPLEPGHARVYTGGPTVYAPQHIGNLRPYLFADLLRRALLAEGLRVTRVINITDVGHLSDDADAGEDKMERAAARSGRSAAEIAETYTQQWLRDRRRLHCLEAEVYCKATEHIPQQIELVRRLEERGYTYRLED